MSLLYVLGDGDRVRAIIDNGLLGGNLLEVRELSQKLTCAMQIISDLVSQQRGWQVVFCGGDDICFTIEDAPYNGDLISELMQQFQDLTGGTMSFGVGTSIEAAYINLRRAKARGGNIVVAHTTNSGST